VTQSTAPKGPLDLVRDVSGPVADAFAGLRMAIAKSGPIDSKHCELITMGAFVAAANETGVRAHCARALAAGATPEEIHQAVLLTMGAATGIGAASNALVWTDAVIAAK